ncbi:11974_t:CDS:2 [Funneliformis geosporum]|uniref:ATP phosphoribosyltransferase n=1 Tax=Funneliformis geosporum TaxID=1117311 RepID=A0A9W4WPE2_9GLOM|nr:11974_t:CDS:2 [Funneliformis geosporum]
MDLIHQLPDRLLFAIPKKGRLHEHCVSLLRGADINFHRYNRLDIALVKNLPIALVFLPAPDIAKFVGEGNVDLGITGQDMVEECQVTDKIDKILELGFGCCKLQVQVPIKSGINQIEELVGKKIVTSFDVLASKYFAEIDQKYLNDEDKAEGKKTKIEYVSGSVEAACALGLADGIIDLVGELLKIILKKLIRSLAQNPFANTNFFTSLETGETMKVAGLKAISTVLETQAILIRNKNPSNPSLVSKITSRIKGVIAAKKYVLLNYNVLRDDLKEATKLTPGRQAPTISPLENSNWVEVQSMVGKDDVAEVMDKLEEIGARDIMLFKIDNCRV